MSQKTVYEHLLESVDNVVKGRRYIIAEIGKVKVSVDDLKSALDQSSMGEVANTVNELKNFIQNAVNTLGTLKNSVSQLASSITALSSTVENTYNIVKNMKAGGVAPSPIGTSYIAPQPVAPSFSAPQPVAPSFSAPQPVAPSFSAPHSAPQIPSSAPSSGGNKFDNVLSAAKSGTVAKDLGVMLDQIRSDLSKVNPLDSKLFELSMEAGRLKSLGAKSLDDNGIATLEGKINKWKSQG
jgi:flagellin-specific chaperone FliS